MLIRAVNAQDDVRATFRKQFQDTPDKIGFAIGDLKAAAVVCLSLAQIIIVTEAIHVEGPNFIANQWLPAFRMEQAALNGV